ncbi:MutS-related protein [Pseudoflavitalea rhizosphaerae]|uniref:MutS-related protein n=1 Tax=Pseudoflavitalea rhizosphaerae TaxID=1884793 RepID=UPI000F8CE709|nr:DNA mismatch repair protein [Pseudoflavitalea rhizosphaerae]
MSFSIDRQTLDELNLLGKFRQGSVYHLFNQVKTRGGEQLLDGMFRDPLTSVTEINMRSSIFRYFQETAIRFPFDVQQVNSMREYLDAGSGKSAITVLAGVFIKKALAGLTRDERFKKIVQGMQATIVTLNKCFAFVEAQKTTGPFVNRMQEVHRILSEQALTKLRNIDIYKELPLQTLARYDHLLKSSFASSMETILDFIYEVDVYIAVSDVSRAKGFTYAEALPAESNLLEATELRHPCIDKAVGNQIRMQEDSNVLFLTGANMAGKSTLMKAVAISLYLAQMGFPVAADSMCFSVREGLYTSINVADNIHLGYSHFYAEVVRVKQAAEAAASGKRLLLMFDELFKGTNVKDAFDGTLSVTEAFADYRKCLFVVSTHIIEVGEALKGKENIRFVYMPTMLEGSVPKYTYKLAEGITEDRQGMMIIRNEGILEMIQA